MSRPMLLLLAFTALCPGVHSFTLSALSFPSPVHPPRDVGSWEQAHALANATVASLTLKEKAGLLAGQGQLSSRCVGNTAAIVHLGIPALCFN
ncbi:hypothetical protein B0H10DRAFT_2038299, partial [Mycena sp. CBHHK59/15]